MTKATMLISVGLAAGFAMADGMSIADARKQVADCVSNPSTMTAVVKQLSAADQRAYLGDVVAAVAKLPGSKEEAGAAYVNVCRAALKGASKDNLAEMIAEVFATVPPEYLPVISESLAGDMLNRAIDSSKTYTDEQYVEIASKTMETVNKRLESADSRDVRSAFAALTFIRGSNNASDKVVAAMVETLPESAREVAAKEWFPAALAEGDNKSYDAMLVAASADDDISPDALATMLVRIAGPQAGDVLLFDLSGANTDYSAKAGNKMQISDAMNNPISESLPALGTGGADSSSDVIARVVEDQAKDQGNNPEPPEPPEPIPPRPWPYQNQNTGY